MRYFFPVEYKCNEYNAIVIRERASPGLIDYA